MLREVRIGRTAEELRDSASPEPREWEAEALAYLDKARCLMASPGLYPDLLDAQRQIGGPYTFTDGVWLWSGDLVYYLKNYHIDLPAEFLEHMRQRNWVPPELSDDEVDAICEQLYGPGPQAAPVVEA